MAEFKDRLEQALVEKGMKPSDLSRLTGIGEGAISQYRKGAYKATQRNLETIAKVLGVSIPWLMGADDNSEPAPVDEGGPKVPEGYERLTPANRAIVDRLIADLAASQSGDVPSDD